MTDDFGVFAPVFKSALGGYLDLLNFSRSDCADAVRLVRECAAADVDGADLLGLLGEFNWRPTLVAAVAAVFLPHDARVVGELWRQFDAGSWVSPQIAVVLSRVDPEFLPEARRRLMCDLNILRTLFSWCISASLPRQRPSIESQQLTF